MDNRRIFEYFLTAMAIALGIPVFALLGAQHGEETAALAYPRIEAAAAPAVKDYKSMVLSSQGGIDKGKDLFQRNCVACHGANADGKGAAAGALNPPPRDFHDTKARWTRGKQPLDIYATLTEGNPGTSMPGFSASMPVADRWALVHYIASLPGVKDDFKPMDDAAAAAWKP